MLIKSNWRNLLPAAVAALAAPVIVGVQAAAADTATVAATVTPQNISVSVSDGNVAYGTLAVNTQKDTTSSGVNDSQTATNDGNVAEDFNITSTNATGGNAWTLAGSVGADQYKHAFCNTGSGSPDPCDTGATWNAITTAGAYQTLGTNIATSGTSKFDLQISTPSSVSDYTLKSITVTVQAVLH
jgi:hypothetical protein